MGTLSTISIGQRFVLHVIENGADCDLGNFTTLEMLFVKPDGSEVTKAAAVLNSPGSDGRLYYDLEAGFLSAGRWTARAICTIDPTHKFYSDKVAFIPGN